MENLLKQELIKNAVAKLDEPWKNLTVKDVAKDLKMGENLANGNGDGSDFLKNLKVCKSLEQGKLT